MFRQYTAVARNTASTLLEHQDDLRRTPIIFAAACSSPEPLKF